MSVREYIGARYVPLFADPLEWDATRTYEPLTVVLYQGNSFTSRQAVPANIDIRNTTYWAQTGNYNAQIEQYRAEVEGLVGQVDENTGAISDEETARQNADAALQTAIANETTARQNADSGLETSISNLQTSITTEATARANADTALQTAITNEATARQNTDTNLANSITRIQNQIDMKGDLLLFGDSWTDRAQGFPDWIPAVTKELAYDNVRNFAVGSAGWITGTRISSQISTANSQLTTAQKENVKTIIVFALVNDLRNVTSDANYTTTRVSIKDEMTSCYVTLRDTYPNAEIHFIPTVCGALYGTGQGFLNCCMFNKWMSSGPATDHYGLPYNTDFFDIYTGSNDNTLYRSDYLHLNNATIGNVIGTRIRELIKGSMSRVDYTVDATITSGSQSAALSIRFSPGHFSAYGRFTVANLAANTNTDFTFDKNNAYTKGLLYVLMSATSSAINNGKVGTLVKGDGTPVGYVQLSAQNGGLNVVRLHNTPAITTSTSVFGGVCI